MMLLVSGATKTLRRLRHPALGQLMRPGNGNVPLLPYWAADNGAFAGFDEAAFVAMLKRLQAFPGCRWVACPDVVCDARATAELFAEWQPRIAALGFPVAWVAQDGASVESAPWAELDCVFVGGSTPWKLGATARGVCAEAKRRGKLVHFGRVNSLRRMRCVHDSGADSVDGTGFSRFPDLRLPRFLRHIETLDRQTKLNLFTTGALPEVARVG